MRLFNRGVMQQDFRFCFLLFAFFLNGCTSSSGLTSDGDAKTHGTVIFDGYVAKGGEIWHLYNPGTQQFVSKENGGGFFRVGSKTSGASYGALAEKKLSCRMLFTGLLRCQLVRMCLLLSAEAERLVLFLHPMAALPRAAHIQMILILMHLCLRFILVR